MKPVFALSILLIYIIGSTTCAYSKINLKQIPSLRANRLLQSNTDEPSSSNGNETNSQYYDPDKKKLMSVSKGDMTGDIMKIRKKFTSIEEGNILAEAILKRADYKEITGYTVLKEPVADFISGVSFNLNNFGILDGIYRIRKSIHKISSDGWSTKG